MTYRMKSSTEYIRRNFSDKELIQMGSDLAQAHNHLRVIDSEFTRVKLSFKERVATVEQKIENLSTDYNNRFTMENIVCTLTYDEPNVGEVSYLNPSGEVVKVRAMTLEERQEELPFDEAGTGPTVVVAPEQSAENIEEFFEKPAEPSAEDLDAVAEEQAVAEATALPANFEAEVRQSMGAPIPFPATLKDQLEQAEKTEVDDSWAAAVKTLKNHPKVSPGLFQRELKVSYTAAIGLIDRMVAEKLIDGEYKKIEPKKKSGPKELAAEHAKSSTEVW